MGAFIGSILLSACSDDDDNGIDVPDNSIQISVDGDDEINVSEDVESVDVIFNTTTISEEDLIVTYEVSGTAENGIDYNIQQESTITILNGESSFTLPISIIDNEEVNEDKTIIINLIEVANENFDIDLDNDQVIITIEDNNSYPYENGFFVLNEGSQTAGTVTYVSQDLQTSEQAIYQFVNEGDDLGNYVQSIFFDGDLAYIISNGSNLITVVNRYTFELVGKVDSGLNVPRYGVVENGKAYVTNQADFSTNEDDYVAVINLQSLEVEQTVVIGDVVEFIEEENGLLYIQNATYGTGNHISVFNPTTNQVENTLTTADQLNSFEIEDGIIYALSANSIQRYNINSLEMISAVDFSFGTQENPLSAANLDIEDDQIYFTVSNSVYTMVINAEEAPEEAVLTYNSNSAYGVMYGFEVEDNRIYIADGGDFGSDSFVEVYDLQGNLLNNITVGVGPNGFYFND